jgi:putative ABC transport system substrate-binding protein
MIAANVVETPFAISLKRGPRLAEIRISGRQGMLTRRQVVLAVGAGALATISCFAQPAGPARIGYLSSESESGLTDRIEGLRAGLRDLGYVEGKNIVIEVRRAEGNYARLPDLAAELVRLKVDVIVAEGTKAGVAAARATTSIPIVLPGADPALTGRVAGLARPGENVTGSSVFGVELAVKRLELLKQAVPRNTKIAFLFNPADPISAPTEQALKAAADSLQVRLQLFEVRTPSDFDSVIAAAARSGNGALLIQGDTLFDSHPTEIARLAAEKRLPSAGRLEIAEAGGLIGYGVNSPEVYRRSALIVDKILKGAKPGDLPIEQPTKFDLIINLKTAKALGLTIQQSLLLRANEVIQ